MSYVLRHRKRIVAQQTAKIDSQMGELPDRYEDSNPIQGLRWDMSTLAKNQAGGGGTSTMEITIDKVEVNTKIPAKNSICRGYKGSA